MEALCRASRKPKLSAEIAINPANKGEPCAQAGVHLPGSTPADRPASSAFIFVS